MNRTSYYLGIALKSNENVAMHIRDLYDKGQVNNIYIDDMDYIAYQKEDDCLFVVIKSYYADSILNLKSSYIRDAYTQGSNYVLVVPIELDNKEWKKDFLAGNYSKIYSQKELDSFILGKNPSFEKRDKVLKKEEDYFEDFNAHIYEIFGTKLEQYDGRELDIPPSSRDEILNYHE